MDFIKNIRLLKKATNFKSIEIPRFAIKSHEVLNVSSKENAIGEAETESAIKTEVSIPDLEYPKVYNNSELVIALIGTVGSNLKKVVDILRDRMLLFNYSIEHIRVSNDVIAKKYPVPENSDEYTRLKMLMDSGNKIRSDTKKNSILALGIASEIMGLRNEKNGQGVPGRVVYIVSSLKHPEEVEVLREVYGTGFFLIGVSEDVNRRIDYLVNDKGIDREKAKELVKRDEDEAVDHGQHTRDAFHMADFFVQINENDDQLKNSMWRILDIVFGSPYITPTFDEYAMFQAFVSSLRSADLSRQVGAVISNQNNEIIAYGANDCPRAGGGLYWPIIFKSSIDDEELGRDYKRGYDSNKMAQKEIVDSIIKNLMLEDNQETRDIISKSKLKELTEYGRIVHAEMEALLMCSRNQISARQSTLYCTTFPCHNCAKHLIAAGVMRVVYVEPYPKSKAFDFYSDAITDDNGKEGNYVKFMPFTGVGPRRFFDLFSIALSTGYKIERKDKQGKKVDWNRDKAILRTPLQPFSYLDKELFSKLVFHELFDKEMKK